MKHLTIAGLFVLFAFTSSFAQSATSINNSPSFDLIELNTDSWSFFSDDNSQLFYIDFEKLTFSISDILLKDADGEIVFEDDVLDLPVNSIYELDLAQFKPGKYMVELRAFTDSLTKDITVK